MSRRTRRLPSIPEPERSDLLAEIGWLRQRMCGLMGTVAIASPDYRALQSHAGHIDELAEAMTGRRDYFQSPPPSSARFTPQRE